MREKVHYSCFANAASFLDVQSRTLAIGPVCYKGYYVHSNGYAVRIYSDEGCKIRTCRTSLTMNYGAKVYSKTINRLYTQRGLMLLCTKFVSDVLSGKIDSLYKQQPKGLLPWDVLKIEA